MIQTRFLKFRLNILPNLLSRFLGKPSRPEGPLDVSNVTKTGCKLKWKKPADDGGSPIKVIINKEYLLVFFTLTRLALK